ncbi:MFS transporter [Glaciimonas sp. PCH181]|uniref:MFS transporter n=1 Tax=Glaciimonas sp. PCH181 TaxID=2133943 RepID=UPI001CECF844|nr:MFS transporter [Glaciimonas sp. PCH181]
MVLLLFLTQACTDIFLPGLPMMAKEFGTTMERMNLIISIYNYSQAVVVLFIGVISDLRGRRSTILTCLALHIIATIWIALSSSLFCIIILRAVQAMGSAAVYIILRLIIKDTMDKKTQIHTTGLLVAGLVLSPILAPVLGAWIIKLSDWRNCFWAIASFEVPLFCWALMAIRETNNKQLEFRSSFSLKKHFLSYYSVLKDGYFLGLALILGSVFAAFYAFISISSYLYINQYGIKETNYPYVFIGIAISYLIGNRLMSKLNANNFPPQRIISFGICVSLIGTAFILAELVIKNTLVTIALTTLGTCLLRLATALINPPIQVVVTNHFNEKGSHALGLLTCIQYSFAAIGTMVVSGLSFNPSGNFMITTFAFVALSLVGFLLAFKKTLLTHLN